MPFSVSLPRSTDRLLRTRLLRTSLTTIALAASCAAMAQTDSGSGSWQLYWVPRNQTLATYSNKDKTTAGIYSQKSFSLAAYRGQTVRLQFRCTTDFSLSTTFRIDDVSLR